MEKEIMKNKVMLKGKEKKFLSSFTHPHDTASSLEFKGQF